MMLPLLQLVEKPTWKSILFDLIARGKVNPWDVDIGVVVEGFMERIREMERLNLYVSGNVVLATAILLKLKALHVEIEEEEEEEVVIEGVEVVEPPVIALPKARPITVEELVEAVERAMERVKRKAGEGRKREVVVEAPSIPLPFQEERVEERIERLYRKLLELSREGIVNISSLVLQEGRKDRVEGVRVLLYSLFLANEGRLELWQVEPFKDILARVKEGKG